MEKHEGVKISAGNVAKLQKAHADGAELTTQRNAWWSATTISRRTRLFKLGGRKEIEHNHMAYRRVKLVCSTYLVHLDGTMEQAQWPMIQPHA